MPAKLYSPLADGSTTSSGIAPSLSTHYTRDTDFELASWDGVSSTASLNNVYTESDLPAYNEGVRFTPSVQFQIQSPGKAAISLPLSVPPSPIPVYAVGSDGKTLDDQAPVYLSIRPARGSGSCILVPGDDAEQKSLSTTFYRFGPGRPPRVALLPPSAGPVPGAVPGTSSSASHGKEGSAAAAAAAWDSFDLGSRGVMTRAVRCLTRLGTFEWRYATRRERKAAGADSLLVLDRVVRVFNSATAPGGKGKEEEVRSPVAQFLRNAELRSPGSKGSSAGNGGRLRVDLSLWRDGKGDAEMVCIMVVTTCISMLKKEIDRRRTQQIAVMSIAVGGGS